MLCIERDPEPDTIQILLFLFVAGLTQCLSCGCGDGVQTYDAFEDCPAEMTACGVYRGNVCHSMWDASDTNHYCMLEGVTYNDAGDNVEFLTGSCPDHQYSRGTRRMDRIMSGHGNGSARCNSSTIGACEGCSDGAGCGKASNACSCRGCCGGCCNGMSKTRCNTSTLSASGDGTGCSEASKACGCQVCCGGCCSGMSNTLCNSLTVFAGGDGAGCGEASHASGCQGGCRGCCSCPDSAPTRSLGTYEPAFGNWFLSVPKRPVYQERPTPLPRRGVVGIAVNGVLFLQHAMSPVFDNCFGHIDKEHVYHYHLLPACLIQHLGGTDSAKLYSAGLRRADAQRSPLIGWALDGWPIFGPYDEHGQLMLDRQHGKRATLDECNGKILDDGSYAYFISNSSGIACFRGKPGRGVNRGMYRPTTRCPRQGTKSFYCASPGHRSLCLSLSTGKCVICPEVSFVFPACPAPNYSIVRILWTGIGYVVMCLAIIYRFILQLVCRRLALRADSDETANYSETKGVFTLHDTELHGTRILSFQESPDKTARYGRTRSAANRMLKTLVKEAKKTWKSRGTRMIRALFVASVCLSIFFLADPYYSQQRLPVWMVSILYGVGFPLSNTVLKDLVIMIFYQAQLLTKASRRKRLYVTLLDYLPLANTLVQLTMDIARSIGLTYSEHRWLVLCQLFFVVLGVFIALLYFCTLRSIYQYTTTLLLEEPLRLSLRIEMEMIAVLAFTKLIHSVLALLKFEFIGLKIGRSDEVGLQAGMDVTIQFFFLFSLATLMFCEHCVYLHLHERSTRHTANDDSCAELPTFAGSELTLGSQDEMDVLEVNSAARDLEGQKTVPELQYTSSQNDTHLAAECPNSMVIEKCEESASGHSRRLKESELRENELVSELIQEQHELEENKYAMVLTQAQCELLHESEYVTGLRQALQNAESSCAKYELRELRECECVSELRQELTDGDGVKKDAQYMEKEGDAEVADAREARRSAKEESERRLREEVEENTGFFLTLLREAKVGTDGEARLQSLDGNSSMSIMQDKRTLGAVVPEADECEIKTVKHKAITAQVTAYDAYEQVTPKQMMLAQREASKAEKEKEAQECIQQLRLQQTMLAQSEASIAENEALMKAALRKDEDLSDRVLTLLAKQQRMLQEAEESKLFMDKVLKTFDIDQFNGERKSVQRHPERSGASVELPRDQPDVNAQWLYEVNSNHSVSAVYPCEAMRPQRFDEPAVPKSELELEYTPPERQVPAFNRRREQH